MRTAIILAGGRGRRFQKLFPHPSKWADKALVELEGAPIFTHVAQRVSTVVDELIVVTDRPTRAELYSDILSAYGLSASVLVDEPAEFRGPMVGAKTGLRHAKGEYCLLLPCDTPFLSPKVVELLFLRSEGYDSAIPVWPNGFLEPLFGVYKQRRASAFADTLHMMGRGRPDDLIRAGSRTRLVSVTAEIRGLDPGLSTFRNINYPEDLSNPPAGVPDGPIERSFTLDLPTIGLDEQEAIREAFHLRDRGGFTLSGEGFRSISDNLFSKGVYFWAALSSEQASRSFSLSLCENTFRANSLIMRDLIEGPLRSAVRSYRAELQLYHRWGVTHLASHTESDAAWCERKLKQALRPGARNKVYPPSR